MGCIIYNVYTILYSIQWIVWSPYYGHLPSHRLHVLHRSQQVRAASLVARWHQHSIRGQSIDEWVIYIHKPRPANFTTIIVLHFAYARSAPENQTEILIRWILD